MSKLDFVLGRVEAGAKVKIVQDRYGQEKILLRLPWVFLKTKLKLSREDTALVKDALRRRHHNTPQPIVRV